MAANDTNELNQLNAAVDRIKAIVPKQPYIQTIPQTGSRWHHHSWEAAQAWRRDAPFGPDEPADLQYQTFYYHEHGTDLIHLRIHSPPPEPRSEKHRSGVTPEVASSAIGTPRLAAAKKKISLADYKSQKVAGPKVNGEQKAQVINGTDEVQDVGTMAKSMVSGVRTPDLIAKDFALSDANSGKRKHVTEEDDHLEAPSPLRRKSSHGSTDQPDQRHVSRITSNTHSQKERLITGHQAPSTPSARLPPPLSPLSHPMPGKLSPLGNVLPDRLSPDLPENIVADLERRARRRAESGSSKSSSSNSRGQASKHDSANGTLDDARRKEGHGRSKQAPKAEQDDAQPSRHHESLPKANADGERGKPAEHGSTDESASNKHSAPRLRRLIVRLKVPKRLRQDMRRLLQFPPRPQKRPAHDDIDSRPPKVSKPATVERSDDSRRALSKLNEQPVQQQDRGHKRPASPSSSRHNQADNLKASAHTPARRPLESPPPRPAAAHQQHTTPSSSKKPSGSAMARVSSTDGFSASPRAATPASTVSAATTTTASTSNPQSNPQADQHMQESQRFATIGRTLKAKGQAHSSAGRRELGLLVMIESVCAFAVSFHCADRAAAVSSAASGPTSAPGPPPRPHSSGSASSPPAALASGHDALHHHHHHEVNPATLSNARKTWITLHGMWKLLLSESRSYPVLRAVVAALGELYLGRVCAWLAASSSAPSSSSSSSSSSSLAMDKADAAVLLGRCLNVAPRLDLALVRAEFPRAWNRWLAQQRRGPASAAAAADDDDVTDRLELPVGLGGDVPVAVRTFVALLAEYRLADGKRFEGSLRFG